MISLSRYSGEISKIKIAGEDEWIAWLRSQKLQFHFQLPTFFKETARGLPILPPLATTSGTLACGSIPSFPLTKNQEIGYNSLQGHSLFPADHSGLIARRGPTSSPLFTTNQVQCWREHTSSPLSTTLSTCLLATQNLASYSVKSLPPG